MNEITLCNYDMFTQIFILVIIFTIGFAIGTIIGNYEYKKLLSEGKEE